MSKKIPGNYIFNKKDGNISVFSVIVILFTAFLILLASDFCRIFTAVSSAKKASDAAALAVSQQLLFFEDIGVNEMAEAIVKENSCTLKSLNLAYDEVTVVAEKHLDFLFLDSFTSKDCKIYSVSKSKVIYPWDESLGLCSSYKFEY